MSNYLALATVTATLQRTLQTAVQGDVDGARITTVRPSNLGMGTPESGINLFLYQVMRNPALNQNDMGSSRNKTLTVRRQTALDLYYILSFYGNDTELEPQRLMGSALRTLHDRTILTPEMVRETVADPTLMFLADSNLADQIQQLVVMPVDMDLEDLSKAWSTFFQTPYFLSVAYKVTVVMLDSEEPSKRALPVRDRNLGGVIPFPQYPVVDQVIAEAGRLEPILATSTLLVRGKQLRSATTLVRIGEAEVTPTQVSDTEVAVSLGLVPPRSLRAGVQGLQIIHQISIGARPSDPMGSRNVESNVVPFVLRPTLKSVRVENLQGLEGDRCDATIVVMVNLPIGARQRVVLVLNEWAVENPAAYLFTPVSRDQDTEEIAIPVQAVKPGRYLVRLQVDGAESQLTKDEDPNSPTYNWYVNPQVEIELP